MANAKRVSLKERRAGDAKGIDALFQGSAAIEIGSEVEPEFEPEVEHEVESEAQEVQSGVQTGGQVAEKGQELLPMKKPSQRAARIVPVAVTQTPAQTPITSAAKPPLAKVTIYIRPEQVIAIEAIQLAERQRTGQKPDKSDLIQEALDLLSQKYGL